MAIAGVQLQAPEHLGGVPHQAERYEGVGRVFVTRRQEAEERAAWRLDIPESPPKAEDPAKPADIRPALFSTEEVAADPERAAALLNEAAARWEAIKAMVLVLAVESRTPQPRGPLFPSKPEQLDWPVMKRLARMPERRR